MPSASDHLAQAQSNDAFSERLVQSEGPHDWAVTVSFYAALHYFEHWLIKKRNVSVLQESRSKGKSMHSYRDVMAKKYLPEGQAAQYIYLRQQSELARYFSTASKADETLSQPPFKYFDSFNSGRIRQEMVQLRDFLLK